jgi:adenine-specific DNA methylase
MDGDLKRLAPKSQKGRRIAAKHSILQCLPASLLPDCFLCRASKGTTGMKKVFSKVVHVVSAIKGVVLDPFMGAGSTGLAAIRLGRKFLGI